MKLIDFLKKERISARSFAKLIGVHNNTMQAYTKGRLCPGAAIAQMIIDVSNGEVSMQDLIRAKQLTSCPTCGRCLHRKPSKKKLIADKLD